MLSASFPPVVYPSDDSSGRFRIRRQLVFSSPLNCAIPVPSLMKRIFLTALILGLLAAGCTRPAPTPGGPEGTTVILVRHAERADDSSDTDLSPEGRQRAELLAKMLLRSGPSVLLASQFKRTQQTLRPLAEALGLPIRIIDAENEHELIEIIRTGQRGRLSVVASHSDRIPTLVARLTGETVEPVEHEEYNRFYVLTLLGEGRGKVIELRYGAGEVDPPEPNPGFTTPPPGTALPSQTGA